MLAPRIGIATGDALWPPDAGAVHETVARRVYREFVEMPDLRVTLDEATRLFGLPLYECAMVLECLVEFGILTRLPNGCYAKPRSE